MTTDQSSQAIADVRELRKLLKRSGVFVSKFATEQGNKADQLLDAIDSTIARPPHYEQEQTDE